MWQASCNGQTTSTKMTNPTHTNALIHESSPYLLQHAHNPVNWFPWKDEALTKARTEDKLMIVSIGYAACHWCHVMEHESFEDTTVARFMNEHFVSIKVDREERPDVDDIYMSAAFMISGSGGWPLNAIALPDGRPVYAGTYYPKDQWLQVLEFYARAFKENRSGLEKQAGQLTEGIRSTDIVPRLETKKTFEKSLLDSLVTGLLSRFDWRHGGQSGHPKFPMPNNYLLLLRQHYHTGDANVLKAATVTLDNMANGGIHDHIGGGFARYSTDQYWKAPHFEKMLYDNGQLVSLYAEAYQLTHDDLYRRVVHETLEWIEREMTSHEGGFYSSLDADSEGEEGTYYVWTSDALDGLLGADAALFSDYYSVKKAGNWERGKNILHVTASTEDIAKRHNLTVEQLTKRLGIAKRTIFEARNKRERPALDDKILTGWNALMLEGYVDAYRVFGESKWLDAALRNADFLLKHAMQSDGRLTRNYKDGRSTINAFLDDYALLAEAFIALYQATFDEQWLHRAKQLTDYAIAHFFDPQSGMFFYTSDEDAPLIARRTELNDNVIPGSNSTMARVLFRLGNYYYNKDYTQKARQMVSNMLPYIQRSPSHNSNWGIVLSEFVNEPFEIAIVGDDWQKLLAEFNRSFLPDVLFLGGASEGSLELLQYKLVENETRIYVCYDKSCRFPVYEVADALEEMKAFDTR